MQTGGSVSILFELDDVGTKQLSGAPALKFCHQRSTFSSRLVKKRKGLGGYHTGVSSHLRGSLAWGSPHYVSILLSIAHWQQILLLCEMYPTAAKVGKRCVGRC